MENNELQHHGILGMKWGVRRFQTKTGALTREGRKRREAAAKAQETKRLKKEAEEQKKAHEEERQKALKSGTAQDIIKFKGELTAKEINDAIDRIDAEAKLSEYANSKSTSKGKKFVKDIMENSAKNIGGQLVTYAMGRAANWMLGGVFNDPKIVNPKKGQKDK
jgi:hypothetical protein